MAAADSFPRVDEFKGLNNRIDPIRLGLEWQLQADNCLCDDAKFLVNRPGQVALPGSGYLDVYGTRDGRLLAIDSSNQLVQLDAQGFATVLQTGVTGAPFQWAELGYALFLMSTTARWAVYPDRIITWGSLCPTATDTYPLGDPISYPPPIGDVLGTRHDRIAVSVWEYDRDRSVLYLSRPGFPHEFRLERDYQIFAGRITMLADTSAAFVIATDRAIYLDPYDAPLRRVAEYGVPLGGLVNDERDIVYFDSERGLCKAPPFENLTDGHFVTQDRQTTTAGMLYWQGSRYAVVQKSGAETTRRSGRPYEPLTVFTVGTIGLTWPTRVLSATGA